MMAVAQELPADAQDHRSMARHQRGKGRFTGRIAPRDEALEELAVGEPGDRAAAEQRFELPHHGRCQRIRHAGGLP